MAEPATCRAAVIEAMGLLERRHARAIFGLDEIVQEVLAHWSSWTESTVRTHVTAHLVSGHGNPNRVVLERVDRARYRLITGFDETGRPVAGPAGGLAVPAPVPAAVQRRREAETGLQFESRAADAMCGLFGVELGPGPVALPGGVVKRFGLVARDRSIVGDAKRYTTLRTPAGKWSTIAEYVWLLQKLDPATRTFLVFGGDVDVPQRWLNRYRSLAAPVHFYFLEGDTVSALR